MGTKSELEAGLETLRVRSIHYRPKLVTPKTEWAFIEVRTSDGYVGIGEATYFRGANNFPAVTANFAEKLVGQPLNKLQILEQSLAESDIIGWAVLSAIEQASWDIYGKRASRPIHTFLGAVQHKKIPLYANINRRTVDRSPAGFAKGVRKARRDGFTQMKIAPFDGMTPVETDNDPLFQAGLDRIKAAHAALDGQGTLMVDCHWRLDLKRALTLLTLAADLKLGWVECPLPETTDTMPDLRYFKNEAVAAGVSVAGGEQGTSQDYFTRILEENVYDIIMPDVKYVGGISNLLNLARIAERHGVTFSPHNPSGPVAHLASLHAMTVTPNLAILEHQFDETPQFWTMGGSPLPNIHNGLSDIPTLEGIGFLNKS